MHRSDTTVSGWIVGEFLDAHAKQYVGKHSADALSERECSYIIQRWSAQRFTPPRVGIGWYYELHRKPLFLAFEDTVPAGHITDSLPWKSAHTPEFGVLDSRGRVMCLAINEEARQTILRAVDMLSSSALTTR